MICRYPHLEKIDRYIQQHYRSPDHRKGKPTFKEFVRYVIDPQSDFNHHWEPVYKLCMPCQLHYDFIGHVETLAQDFDYVLNKLKIRKVVLTHMNPSHKSKHKTDNSEVEKEISTLALDELRNLTDKYRLDFLLFGYPLPSIDDCDKENVAYGQLNHTECRVTQQDI